jgi:hypothetical protein
MHKGFNSTMRAKIITVGEVFDILNEFNVKVDMRAQCKIVKRAKHRRTPAYIADRVWEYTKAFFRALIYTVHQKLNVKGRYSKGGVIDGRKDM